MSVLLALLSALSYGVSDFVGGLASRRASAWPVAVAVEMCAAVMAWVMAAATGVQFSGHTALLALAAGTGGAVGSVFLYRGLSSGQMNVVAPLSAMGSAIIPVIAGFVSGDRPGVLAVIGVILALPAVWLISGGSLTGRLGSHVPASSVVNGLMAGAGFGAQFAVTGFFPRSEGFTPLALSITWATILLAAAAATLRQPVLPRRIGWTGAVIAGILVAVGIGLFQVAASLGMLAVAGVISSLYPAATVLLAVIFLKERSTALQMIGLAAAVASVVLVGVA